MRVRFKIEGGVAHFPGLSQPVTIDSAELGEEEASELKRQVEEVGRTHTVRLTDPVEDPTLQRLVSSLNAKAKALRRVSRARREPRSG